MDSDEIVPRPWATIGGIKAAVLPPQLSKEAMHYAHGHVTIGLRLTGQIQHTVNEAEVVDQS
ncbi:hypothetical protein FRB98_006409 [Tulasnella sp. 332]|nr:hypothetical protein FRB98_006409 [Tulasnella sp. 332]